MKGFPLLLMSLVFSGGILIWPELSERTQQDIGVVCFIVVISVGMSCLLKSIMDDSRIQSQMRDDQAKILRHQAQKIDEEDASQNS